MRHDGLSEGNKEEQVIAAEAKEKEEKEEEEEEEDYDVGPTENGPVVEGSETAGTHEGSVGCEMEMSRDTERAVAADSHVPIDVEQSKSRHTVNQARKYTPKIIIIEEVTNEQQKDEYDGNEDVDEEGNSESEKISHGRLSDGNKEEQWKTQEDVVEKEEKR
ncbi:hypothetical protein SprV_0802463900 [Sparganum proliferum]